MYNARTNKIMCPDCRVEMRPFGGRFSPWATDIPEVFLCIQCGYWIDMQEAITEAMLQQAVIRRRYESVQRYMYGSNGHIHNGHRPTIRQRVLKVLVNWLEK